MKIAKMFICVVVASLFLAAGAFAEINWSAGMETNTDFESNKTEKGRADGKDLENTVFAQGGRLKVTAEGKSESDTGFFAAAKGQLKLNLDGTASTDDSWVQVGTSSFSLKVGRFEGEGLFSKGADVYIVSAPGGADRYEANKARGRSSNGMALDFSAGENMMIQVGMVYGGSNQLGARPLVKFSTDTVTIKAGADYLRETPQDNDAKEETTYMGFGVDASAGFGSMTIGGAGAYLTQGGKDAAGTDLKDQKTLSVWGYLKMAVGEGDELGVGAGMTSWEDDGSKDKNNHLQGYVSYAHALPAEGAKVKFGASFASADIEPKVGTKTTNSAFGARVRFNYDF
jgi:hypothetical protein